MNALKRREQLRQYKSPLSLATVGCCKWIGLYIQIYAYLKNHFACVDRLQPFDSHVVVLVFSDLVSRKTKKVRFRTESEVAAESLHL